MKVKNIQADHFISGKQNKPVRIILYTQSERVKLYLVWKNFMERIGIIAKSNTEVWNNFSHINGFVKVNHVLSLRVNLRNVYMYIT